MRIGKRLKLNFWISLVSILVMILSLALSFYNVRRTEVNSILADKMNDTAFVRSILRSEYLLNYSERARVQIEAKTEILRDALEMAMKNFTEKSDRELCENIKKDFDNIEFIFSKILKNHDRDKTNGITDLTSSEGEKRLLGQILLNSSSLNDTIARLHVSADNQSKRAERIITVILVIFIIILVITAVVNSALINKIITKRLEKLRTGTEILGNGNLDFRIEASGDDEFSDISCWINDMTANLKNSYTSLDNLKKEIESRARAEEGRAQALLNLERSNRELEQVIYVTSHDLRSPLVNVQGFSSILESSIAELASAIEAVNPPEDLNKKISGIMQDNIIKSLKFITKSITKMDTLLSGLLVLSRLGRAEIKIKPLDMEGIFSSIADNFRFKINEMNIDLKISKLPPCRGDEKQVNQAFSNLLDNAIKYLQPGRKGKIAITGSVEGDTSIYSIEDNGIGIAKEHEDKIFEIFHRLNPDSCPGDGLGLNIVTKIVERNNGRVWVESKPDMGSRFFISLPGV